MVTDESLDSLLVAKLRELYASDSKHGNYHPLPERLRSHFPGLEIDPRWRDPRPRLALLTSQLASNQTTGPIVELGANTGYQTLGLASRHPNLEVIALEVNSSHAEFITIAARLDGLQNVTVIEGAFTPRQVADRWPGATVLDFNVVHHAGHDFRMSGVEDVTTWWEFGLPKWLEPVGEFADYWFSCGYRMGGQHDHELHDPDDPDGFVRRVIHSLPPDASLRLAVWMAGPSTHGIDFLQLDHNADDLGASVRLAERVGLYHGEYFKRPIFRFHA